MCRHGLSALAKALNKFRLRAGVCDGFIGQPVILGTYRTAADPMFWMVRSPYQNRQGVVDCGFAMGPFAVATLAGLGHWLGPHAKAQGGPLRHPAERVRSTTPIRSAKPATCCQKTGKGFVTSMSRTRVGAKPSRCRTNRRGPERAETLGIHPRDFTDAGNRTPLYGAEWSNEAANGSWRGHCETALDVDIGLPLAMASALYGVADEMGRPARSAGAAGPASRLRSRMDGVRVLGPRRC